MTDSQEKTSTPHAELIAELMNPNNPKNEREHAAVREIERLRESLKQRTWVGLTKDEMETLSYKAEGNTWIAIELAEAKLKEKNR